MPRPGLNIDPDILALEGITDPDIIHAFWLQSLGAWERKRVLLVEANNARIRRWNAERSQASRRAHEHGQAHDRLRVKRKKR